MSGLKKLLKQVNDMQRGVDSVAVSELNDLGERLVKKAREYTPVDSGVLRDGFKVTEVVKNNGVYSCSVVNDVEYASYVEYGHRTRDNGWVNGVFMLGVSEYEVGGRIRDKG